MNNAINPSSSSRQLHPNLQGSGCMNVSSSGMSCVHFSFPYGSETASLPEVIIISCASILKCCWFQLAYTCSIVAIQWFLFHDERVRIKSACISENPPRLAACTFVYVHSFTACVSIESLDSRNPARVLECIWFVIDKPWPEACR